MIKEIQITLYDIFGYLLPGLVILIAVITGFWTIFWWWLPLPVPATLPYTAMVTFLFAAYLAGHLGQGIANVLVKQLEKHGKLDRVGTLSKELMALVRQAAVSHFGESVATLDSGELLHLCDQALLFHGSTGEREIFTYREGFYRGNSIALALLTLAIGLRALRKPIGVVMWGTFHQFSRWPLVLTALITGLGAVLAFQRYVRFAQVGSTSCYLRFLSLSAEERNDKKPK